MCCLSSLTSTQTHLKTPADTVHTHNHTALTQQYGAHHLVARVTAAPVTLLIFNCDEFNSTGETTYKI